MKKPNFFILGAPKCGTTSLAAWLAEHPQVFFCPVKEPSFFNFDFAGRITDSLREYERLFSDATPLHIAVGEASTSYLYSRTAVPAILEYTENPRFIVMTRDPVEMVYSLHEQTIFNGDEDEKEFERAWELQKIRVYGGCIPRACADPQRLFYGALCQLGAQLQQLFNTVSPEQVLVLNIEHIKRDARTEYLRVLQFLELEDDQRGLFPVVNSAKAHLYPRLWHCVRRMNQTLRAAGIPRLRIGVTRFLYYQARQERPRPTMSPAMRRRLREYFAEDIVLLEKLTGWDLAHWKANDDWLGERTPSQSVSTDRPLSL